MTTYNVVQPMSLNQIHDRFKEMNRDNFSLEALEAILDLLEEWCEGAIDLDIIAICCDYTECSIEEALNDFDHYVDEEVCQDMDNCLKADYIVMEINARTWAILLDNGNILYQNF